MKNYYQYFTQYMVLTAMIACHATVQKVEEKEPSSTKKYLPNEVLDNCFSYLETPGLQRMREVCKKWNEVGYSNLRIKNPPYEIEVSREEDKETRITKLINRVQQIIEDARKEKKVSIGISYRGPIDSDMGDFLFNVNTPLHSLKIEKTPLRANREANEEAENEETEIVETELQRIINLVRSLKLKYLRIENSFSGKIPPEEIGKGLQELINLEHVCIHVKANKIDKKSTVACFKQLKEMNPDLTIDEDEKDGLITVDIKRKKK